MVIDILLMLAMSDKPERVFLGTRRTITWDRLDMIPEVVEWRECLKHWKRSNIIQEV